MRHWQNHRHAQHLYTAYCIYHWYDTSPFTHLLYTHSQNWYWFFSTVSHSIVKEPATEYVSIRMSASFFFCFVLLSFSFPILGNFNISVITLVSTAFEWHPIKLKMTGCGLTVSVGITLQIINKEMKDEEEKNVCECCCRRVAWLHKLDATQMQDSCRWNALCA